MVWLAKWLVFQIIIRGIGWLVVGCLALVGAGVPPNVLADVAAVLDFGRGVLASPWFWCVAVPGEMLVLFAIHTRRDRARLLAIETPELVREG